MYFNQKKKNVIKILPWLTLNLSWYVTVISFNKYVFVIVNAEYLNINYS